MKKLVCFVVSFILLFATFSFATAETYDRDKFERWIADWFTTSINKEPAFWTGMAKTDSHSLALCEEYIFAYFDYMELSWLSKPVDNQNYMQELLVYDVGAETAISLKSGQAFDLDTLEFFCKFYDGEENEVSNFFVELYNLSNSAPREIYQYLIEKYQCTIIRGLEP